MNRVRYTVHIMVILFGVILEAFARMNLHKQGTKWLPQRQRVTVDLALQTNCSADLMLFVP